MPPIGHDSPNPSPIGHGEIRNNVASSVFRMGWLMGIPGHWNVCLNGSLGSIKQGGILGFHIGYEFGYKKDIKILKRNFFRILADQREWSTNGLILLG